MEKKSQHYIPQTYLSEFIDTTVVKKNWKPTVHIFHWKNENEIVYLRQKPPKNICEESNYYSLNDADEDDRIFIENSLQISESYYSKILRKIKKEENLTYEEKAQLSEFISLMFFRVPLKEESLKESILGINDIIMHMATCTKDGFIEEMRKSNIAGDMSDEELENIRQLYINKKIKASVNKGYINKLRFTACEEIAKCVYYMKWDILSTPEKIDFFTNDNPVCLFDPVNNRYLGFRSSRTVEMYFPLTSKLCLRGCYIGDNTNIKKEIISESEVKKINSIILEHSYKYVFSSKAIIEWYNGEVRDK